MGRREGTGVWGMGGGGMGGGTEPQFVLSTLCMGRHRVAGLFLRQLPTYAFKKSVANTINMWLDFFCLTCDKKS